MVDEAAVGLGGAGPLETGAHHSRFVVPVLVFRHRVVVLVVLVFRVVLVALVLALILVLVFVLVILVLPRRPNARGEEEDVVRRPHGRFRELSRHGKTPLSDGREGGLVLSPHREDYGFQARRGDGQVDGRRGRHPGQQQLDHAHRRGAAGAAGRVGERLAALAVGDGR